MTGRVRHDGGGEFGPVQYGVTAAVLLFALVCLVMTLGGCADTKIGKAVNGAGFSAVDPANTGSQMILDKDGSVVMNSNGTFERANIDDRFFEHNGGGVQKNRRYTNVGFSDSNQITIYESTAANETLGEMTVAAPGGAFESLTIKGRNTDQAVVFQQVVNLYTANLQAAIKGTDAEFQAVIQKIKSQEAVSKAAVDTVVPMLQAVRTWFNAGL